MRKHFRCSVCGQKGCVFVSPAIDREGIEPFPTGDEVIRMYGERRPGESYEMRDARVLAEYLTRYPCGDAIRTVDGMCNLYSVRTSKDEIRKLARALGEMLDTVGNFEPIPAIFPDRMAPVVRHLPDGDRELTMMRWGWPPRPPLAGEKASTRPITNIRNTTSRFWTPWLRKIEHRCLVPVTAFCEPDNGKGPKSVWTWFARDEARSPFFFAGMWREWEGQRGTKASPVVGKHLVFSFLTTDPNDTVRPVHPDAMPVLLMDEAQRQQWMNAPMEEALLLQRPAANDAVRVVATGSKEDLGAPPYD